MSHCIDCIHWDEDKADEMGIAECNSPSHRLYLMMAARKQWVTKPMVPGDHGCEFFTPKRATPAPKG